MDGLFFLFIYTIVMAKQMEGYDFIFLDYFKNQDKTADMNSSFIFKSVTQGFLMVGILENFSDFFLQVIKNLNIIFYLFKIILNGFCESRFIEHHFFMASKKWFNSFTF